MKKKPYELTYEEFNNFREKNPEGDIFYHVVSDKTGLNIDVAVKDIIENGFKFGMAEGLTQRSISFFADSKGAHNFNLGSGQQTILFKMPKRAKFLDTEDKTIFYDYIDFLEAEGITTHHELKENLALKGYHGVTNYAHGGLEYRVYDKDILDEGMSYTNGHKLHVYDALKAGIKVPDEVLVHYDVNEFDINVDMLEKRESKDTMDFLKNKMSGKVIEAKKRKIK